jgi:hypothetical protein
MRPAKTSSPAKFERTHNKSVADLLAGTRAAHLSCVGARKPRSLRRHQPLWRSRALPLAAMAADGCSGAAPPAAAAPGCDEVHVVITPPPPAAPADAVTAGDAPAVQMSALPPPRSPRASAAAAPRCCGRISARWAALRAAGTLAQLRAPAQMSVALAVSTLLVCWPPSNAAFQNRGIWIGALACVRACVRACVLAPHAPPLQQLLRAIPLLAAAARRNSSRTAPVAQR